MLGPGKYDDALTAACKATGATCAVLIVSDGSKGPGFACQGTPPFLTELPKFLRMMADDIDTDIRQGLTRLG